MNESMFRELLSYATSLVAMQRLEGRRSVLKRLLGWKNFQLPASLSAAMRRRQNKDLECPVFQRNLSEYLADIGSLHQGSYHNKTQLLETLARSSAQANHNPLTLLRSQKDRFVEELSKTCSDQASSDLSTLQREHVKASMAKGKFCALPGLLHAERWTVFRVLHINPSSNMYLQKSCHLATDDAWTIVEVKVLASALVTPTVQFKYTIPCCGLALCVDICQLGGYGAYNITTIYSS